LYVVPSSVLTGLPVTGSRGQAGPAAEMAAAQQAAARRAAGAGPAPHSARMRLHEGGAAPYTPAAPSLATPTYRDRALQIMLCSVSAFRQCLGLEKFCRAPHSRGASSAMLVRCRQGWHDEFAQHQHQQLMMQQGQHMKQQQQPLRQVPAVASGEQWAEEFDTNTDTDWASDFHTHQAPCRLLDCGSATLSAACRVPR